MVFSAFTFSPSARSDEYSDIQQDTVTAIYNTFVLDNLYKPYCDQLIADTNNFVESCTGTNSSKSNIDALYSDFVEELNDYKHAVTTSASTSTKNSAKEALKLSISNLKTEMLNNGIDLGSQGLYKVLVSSENYNALTQAFNNVEYYLAGSSVAQEQHTTNLREVNKFDAKIQSLMNQFVYPVVSEDAVLELDTMDVELSTTLDDIEQDMADLLSSLTDENAEKSIKNRQTMNNLVEKYYKTSLLYSRIVSNTIETEIFADYSAREINDFKYLEKYNKYNAEENYAKNSYLWETKTFDSSFATPIAFNSSSNLESANAYDFMYYAIEIFAFVIVVYVLFLACNSIAGEKSDGTIKLIAIKPIDRKKIFRGKLLFSTIVATILIAFSAVVAFIVGAFLYGLSSAPILAVFNSTLAFTIHPILYMLIYLVSLFIKTFVFICVGMLLSTLFNSGTVASMFGMLIYFFDLVIGTILFGKTILQFLPLHNLTLIPFFGNIPFANNSGILAKLFSSTISATPTLWLTLGYIVILSVICIWLGNRMFKKKDLA